MNTEYLKDWNCENEQSKADFIEYLYRFYGKSDGLYTGLWERFKTELWERFKADAAKAARAQVSELGLSIEDVLWGGLK